MMWRGLAYAVAAQAMRLAATVRYFIFMGTSEKISDLGEIG